MQLTDDELTAIALRVAPNEMNGDCMLLDGDELRAALQQAYERGRRERDAERQATLDRWRADMGSSKCVKLYAVREDGQQVTLPPDSLEDAHFQGVRRGRRQMREEAARIAIAYRNAEEADRKFAEAMLAGCIATRIRALPVEKSDAD